MDVFPALIAFTFDIGFNRVKNGSDVRVPIINFDKKDFKEVIKFNECAIQLLEVIKNMIK